MSFGDIKLRLVKQFPGVDPELLDGWIFDRYQQILDRLPWQRLDAQWALNAPGVLQAGTVSITQGDSELAGNGTSWGIELTGRSVRLSNDGTYYQFQFELPNLAYLDRPYQGASLIEAPYTIFQNIFPLPGDVRVVRGIHFMEGGGELRRLGNQQFNRLARDRRLLGHPRVYRLFMDDWTQGLPQIEIFPVPYDPISLRVEYTMESPAFSPANVTLLPWARPSAILAGVSADATLHLDKLSQSDRYRAEFDELVENMVRSESHRAGPLQSRLPDRYVAHRMKRILR